MFYFELLTLITWLPLIGTPCIVYIMYTKYASGKRFLIFKITNYLYIYLRIGLNSILLPYKAIIYWKAIIVILFLYKLQFTCLILISKHLANLKMKFLLLLAILPLSYQDITEKQQEFCTRNDNGDIWKYDLTSLGLVDKP